MIQQLKDLWLRTKQDRAAKKRNAALVASLNPSEVAHFKLHPDARARWYGNHYGGFYAVEPQNARDAVVYSVGIGQDVSFDQAIHKAWGCTVHAVDPTPKSQRWLARQKGLDFIQFKPYGLGSSDGPATFYLPESDKATSGSLTPSVNPQLNRPVEVQLRTLSSLMKEWGHARIDVLKMDIEGAEYEVLPEVLQSGVEVDQILIEFHDRWVQGLPSKKVHAELEQHGYRLVAHSAHYEEFTYLKTTF